jgi:translin
MKNIKLLTETLEKELDEKDTIREIALKSSRAIIRLASSAIHSLHKREDISKLILETREEVTKLQSLLEDHPDLYYSGFVDTALREFCELNILVAIIYKKPLPMPKELGVSAIIYLQALSDVVGELRRFVLDALRTGKIKDARRTLETMENIFTMLIRFDYPTALGGVRRLQDIARSLVEKTRGELTVAIRGSELEKTLKKLERKMRSKI